MELGTIECNGKTYNLDDITTNHVKRLLKNTEKNSKKTSDLKIENIEYKAILGMALAYKMTFDVINEKVNNKRNALVIEVREFNPDFDIGVKNYEELTLSIEDALEKYKKALIKLSKKYDSKIEKLILNKTQLEIDKLKNAYKIQIIKNNIENNIKESLSEIEEKNRELEENIKNINSDVNGLSEEKHNKLVNAMESENKWVSVNVKGTKRFAKIKRFFIRRFNTAKLIQKKIIIPLNNLVNAFNETEV